MDFIIKNICVPLNFSDSATNALRMALRITVANNAQLHVIHVVRPMGQQQFTNVRRKVLPMLKNLMTRTIRKMTKDPNENLEILTLIANFEIRMGNVGQAVREFEKSTQIDLTVIGTHGIMGLKELVNGTKAMEILKYTSCPVITIPREFQKRNIESVLYPIRNAKDVQDKLDYLIPFTIKNELRMHLLAIYNVSREDEVYELTNKLKEVRDVVRFEDVKVTFETRASKSIARTISEVAVRMHIDLIVINATMDKKWYDLFASHNFTNKMINNAIVPMLCIKPELLNAVRDNKLDGNFDGSSVYIPMM